jgi:hypothetical protein
MLPGLRILFAITLLSVSVVIFGLGAAAFLRSAHEDVANAPWRPIETPVTARVDLAPTTLSMLRVEPEATIAAITARADAEAAAAASPAETKPPVATDAAPPPTFEPHAEAPITAKPAEAAAVAPEPPPAPQTIVAAVEPAREQAPAVAEATAAEPRVAEAKAEDAKAAPTADTQPAPTVVAALNTDKVEQMPAKSAFEPVAAPQESLDVPVSTVIPAETNAGADTLKADDKVIQPAKVAVLGEPAAAAPPLPSKDVKIPAPRVDPAVIEARRKHQQMLVQRARARAAAAARARRVAAARARAARAAAAAAAATNPFGAPANTTTNNIRTN